MIGKITCTKKIMLAKICPLVSSCVPRKRCQTHNSFSFFLQHLSLIAQTRDQNNIRYNVQRTSIITYTLHYTAGNGKRRYIEKHRCPYTTLVFSLSHEQLGATSHLLLNNLLVALKSTEAKPTMITKKEKTHARKTTIMHYL